MNDQTNMAQLRYLEELKISLVHAGFEPERIEDQHLPVRWENHYLCRVSGRGSMLYRQENVDGIGAQDALQTVIHIAAMTAEYMTAMERDRSSKPRGWRATTASSLTSAMLCWRGIRPSAASSL